MIVGTINPGHLRDNVALTRRVLSELAAGASR
jgi:hypothetical protein